MSRIEERAGRLAAWQRPVTDVRLVSADRAQALSKLGVLAVEDLLRHYPFRYLDLTSVATLVEVHPGTEVTVVGKVHSVTVKRPRRNLSIIEVGIVDGTGALIGVWFNQAWLQTRFKEGQRVAFAGRVQLDYGLKQIRNPFFEILPDEASAEDAARIIPIHRATAALSTNWVRRLVAEALDVFGDVPDFVPAGLAVRRDLVPLAAALRAVHFPSSSCEAADARRRLAYDELLCVQLGMALRRHALVEERRGVAHVTDGLAMKAMRAAIPFELTGEQTTASAEILADMASERPMNRMLLGDVGTGKTVLAALAIAAAADTGGQAAMMAPTEVLAAQYAEKVGPLLEAAGITWALLTNATPAARRREVLAGLADGSLAASFGTHALLGEAVAFQRLTLAVVDEQHRFGVTQRLGLRAKGDAADMLVMTATPIPRSLALTLYGDLDTSYLRVRPHGREGAEVVATEIIHRADRQRAYDRLRAEVSAGRQAYVVCALVEESDAADAKAATAEAERLATEVLPDLRVGLLTGQMKPAEKSAAMDAFRAGETDVLVATTVIEVGVDVPNATLMIVEDAERFGLAQLHQLRGRVGRGRHAGHFLLFADPGTDEGRRRMDAIVSTDDGFSLAEQDLALRGEGQVLGERQHGLPELRIASIVRDADLLEDARRDARALVASDTSLASAEHAPLAAEVRRRFSESWEWVSSG